MRMWRWLGVALFVLAGCQSTNPEVKPKHQPEAYTVPPSNDSRYNSNMTYPEDTLFKDIIKKDTGPGDPMKTQPGRFGAGPGMGAGGY
jgi:hypothetical protein